MNGTGALGYAPATATVVSATGSSVSAALTIPSWCNALYVCNTSATLYVAIRVGVGAPTASLTADLIIPPLGSVVIGVNSTITHVAAIGSASGPTIVGFCPVHVD